MILKRDNTKVKFDKSRIVVAIIKAMRETEMGIDLDVANKIADDIESVYLDTKGYLTLTVEEIQNLVEDGLVENDRMDVCKKYIIYRENRRKIRENTTDKGILSLVSFDNKDLMMENSNKNPILNSTQRDLIAGEISKDIYDRYYLPAHLVKAHNDGIIHIHDKDYMLQPMTNCSIIDLQDMLDNGTVINEKQIRTPNSFRVACTITTQILAQVTSAQWGGVSINGIDRILAPYAKKSYDRYYQLHFDRLYEMLSGDRIELHIKSYAEMFAERDIRKEITDGIQTIQYQINTLNSTNGQSPFVTFLLYFDPNDKNAEFANLIQREILKQRYEGIENEIGIKMPTAFPKLIYVLDDFNMDKESKYYDNTLLSAKASAKTLMPDYISAKRMREVYEGNVFVPMGCRSFLSPWKDENGNYKFEGRFNFGVVSINLPDVALASNGDLSKFYELLAERLDLIKEVALLRYEQIKDTPSDVAPILWQHGGISRLKSGETIGRFLKGGYATYSVGYIGLYETVKALTGDTHTTDDGENLTHDILSFIRAIIDEWKEETNIGFALYGTPSENMAGRLCNLTKERYGIIKDITDKGYFVNSYHVDVREEIDAFSKLKFEAPFQRMSTGGTISYVEVPNLQNNIPAVMEVIKFIYNTNIYAELNTKADLCHVCKFKGEIIVNDNLEWECPQCHNTNTDDMTVIRRTCGYLGTNFWSEGRTKDIKDRVLHL